MTADRFWHLVVGRAERPSVSMSLQFDQQIFKEISRCDEIERIAFWRSDRQKWLTVASGDVAVWRTRLWSLPNGYTVPVTIKPRTREWVNEVLGEATW